MVAASTTSSITSSLRFAPATPRKGVLPRWASTFRISAWKTTMIPKTRKGRKVRSIQLTVSRFSRSDVQKRTTSTNAPSAICTAWVPRMNSRSW